MPACARPGHDTASGPQPNQTSIYIYGFSSWGGCPLAPRLAQKILPLRAWVAPAELYERTCVLVFESSTTDTCWPFLPPTCLRP